MPSNQKPDTGSDDPIERSRIVNSPTPDCLVDPSASRRNGRMGYAFDQAALDSHDQYMAEHPEQAQQYQDWGFEPQMRVSGYNAWGPEVW